MTAQELKDRMLARIEHLKELSEWTNEEQTLSPKDLFILEHFIRGFPISREGKEVKTDEDADDQADVQHGPDWLADTGG